MSEVKKSKRVKRVFSTSAEVYHMWASQSQEQGRQGGRITRAFFSGTSCYSYGRHFEAGRLVKINGNTVALVNGTRYSHTTSKHTREVENAVSHMPTILVDSSFDWRKGLLETQGKLIDSLMSTLNQRKFYSGYKVWKTDTYGLKRDFERFNETCDAVGKSELKLEPDADLIQIIQAHVSKRARITKRENKAAWAARDAERAELLVKAKDALKDWLNGASVNSSLLSYVNPAQIRIRAGMVETTQGASVSIWDAKTALQAILDGNMQPGDKVGSYEFTSLEGDVLTIGCHVFSLSEVKRVIHTAFRIKEAA